MTPVRPARKLHANAEVSGGCPTLARYLTRSGEIPVIATATARLDAGDPLDLPGMVLCSSSISCSREGQNLAHQNRLGCGGLRCLFEMLCTIACVTARQWLILVVLGGILFLDKSIAQSFRYPCQVHMYALLVDDMSSEISWFTFHSHW